MYRGSRGDQGVPALDGRSDPPAPYMPSSGGRTYNQCIRDAIREADRRAATPKAKSKSAGRPGRQPPRASIDQWIAQAALERVAEGYAQEPSPWDADPDPIHFMPGVQEAVMNMAREMEVSRRAAMLAQTHPQAKAAARGKAKAKPKATAPRRKEER